MGHSEMLLAVAGVDKQDVENDTECLASGEWSRFPLSERVALSFVRKQAQQPATITPADVKQLVRHLGRERALDVIWWSCHCHYLTRIANAFQLPLERINVFDGFRVEERPAQPTRAVSTGVKGTAVMK